ncbi:MAG: cytochrome b5 domain-containing protein [Candidatus Moranbacteria bacterium]|nr:cytochrome b5 domain-containing protein [Candidatus Moranbacteria bacterium]
MTKQNIIIASVVFAVVVGAGYFIVNTRKVEAPEVQDNVTTSQNMNENSGAAGEDVMVGDEEQIEDMTGKEKGGEAIYTLEDVAKHATREDCWTAIEGTVADVTNFFGTHPGGDDNLAKACGKDATEIFKSVKKHDPNGFNALMNMKIGTLEQ